MAKVELLVFIAFAAFAFGTDVDDAEQKKRGIGKGTTLNSVTTGAQKDYTYSIYTQNPNSQTGQSSTYQSQVSNSFYPNQGSSHYYSASNNQADPHSAYQSQSQAQINFSNQPTSAQFVPLNFVPNSGYQSKYQIVPTKPSGSLQVAILQQPPSSYPTASIVPYAPSLFSPHASSNPHQNSLISSLSSGQYNVAPNYQQFGASYLSQPSTMLLLTQPNPTLYNNHLYPNPVQSVFNYYPTNSQNKYVPYTPSASDYERLQGQIPQSVSKEENDISNSEYTAPSDNTSSYKNAYSASRNTYSKI